MRNRVNRVENMPAGKALSQRKPPKKETEWGHMKSRTPWRRRWAQRKRSDKGSQRFCIRIAGSYKITGQKIDHLQLQLDTGTTTTSSTRYQHWSVLGDIARSRTTHSSLSSLSKFEISCKADSGISGAALAAINSVQDRMQSTSTRS